MRVSIKLCSAVAALIVLALSYPMRAQQGIVFFPKSTTHGIHTDAEQPDAGAHVYLFAVGTSGPNTNPVSLLSGTGVLYDANGNGYVTTDSSGNFNITGLYASNCPSSSSRVYLMALEGNPGGGNNTAIAEMAVLTATCPNLPYVIGLYIDPRTTVAAAFALTAFANSTSTPADGFSTDSNSATALGNAITYANNLVSSYTGATQTSAPVAMLNTLADIISICVNSTGPTSYACVALFGDTTTSYITPTDVWQSSLSMAYSPSNNVTTLYDLTPAFVPFQPEVSSAPSSWTITPVSPALAPSISSLSASSGAAGDYITLAGTNFSGSSPSTNTVVLGGVQATITSSSSTSITIQVPANAGTGFIQVYGNGFGSNAVAFTVN